MLYDNSVLVYKQDEAYWEIMCLHIIVFIYDSSGDIRL